MIVVATATSLAVAVIAMSLAAVMIVVATATSLAVAVTAMSLAAAVVIAMSLAAVMIVGATAMSLAAAAVTDTSLAVAMIVGGIDTSLAAAAVTATAAALAGRPTTNSSISRKACANRSIFGDHRSIDAAIEHPLMRDRQLQHCPSTASNGRVAGTPTASRRHCHSAQELKLMRRKRQPLATSEARTVSSPPRYPAS